MNCGNKILVWFKIYFLCIPTYMLLHIFTDICTTIHRYPILSARYSIMCKVYTGYHGTSEIEHGLCACTVDNPLAKARGLSLRTGAQTMLYLSHIKRDSGESQLTYSNLYPILQ